MNLLEHYILDVLDVTPLDKETGYPFLADSIRAVVEVDCYGVIEVQEHIVDKEKWEQEKAQGYYLA